MALPGWKKIEKSQTAVRLKTKLRQLAGMGEIHQPELEQIADVFQRLDRGDIDRDAASRELATL